MFPDLQVSDLNPFGIGRILFGNKASMTLEGLVFRAEQAYGSLLVR